MMMREILFRGKHELLGTWVEGDIRFWFDETVTIFKNEHTFALYHVKPDTVGQYTGLADKNGKKIFEGDIVVMTLPAAKMHWRAVCKFHSGAFGLVWHHMSAERWQAFTGICNAEYEVIGNIYDNPELAEDE
jgi:uncharacterized phage protein (TIGR01671 family)